MRKPGQLVESFPDGRTVCYFYRDAEGFCRLTNRCWVGKKCPKNTRQANAAWLALKVEAIASRSAAHGGGS